MAIALEAIEKLRHELGDEHVIREPEQLLTYASDGLSSYRATPELVVLPRTTEEVQFVLRLCSELGLPFVARGAGTGLSGGALPVAEGIVIALTRMTSVLEVDLESQRVTVESGVTNTAITHAVEADGWFYAPDPSSQHVCTIGGNVAENSGGAHCLKNGFTVNHVTGMTIVLSDGEIVEIGGKSLDQDDCDLLAAIVGSEGTLGIVTEVTVRVVRKPEAVVTMLAAFDSIGAASDAVSGVIRSGILAAAIEMMDALALMAAERAFAVGYPSGAQAVLIVELDGVDAQVSSDVESVKQICEQCGATEVRTATDPAERAKLWKGRKGAFPAMGRISPNYYVQDGVVPRSALPEVMRNIGTLAERAGLQVANVFHAGDGNLHPMVLYGEAPGEAERAKELAEDILSLCLDAGGSITGEHGVGVDKACSMPLMFSEDDLAGFERLRRAFDPAGLANPGKLVPTPRLCGEVPGPYRMHPLERMGVADRF